MLDICWGPILVIFLVLRYNDMTKATHRRVYLVLWFQGSKSLAWWRSHSMAAGTGC